MSSEVRREFIPDLSELEDLRQGYRIMQLSSLIPNYEEKKYRLDFMLTLPGILRIWRGEKLLREVKTYQNFVLKVVKAYTKNGVEYDIVREPLENGYESLNPVMPLSPALLERLSNPLKRDETIELPNPRDIYLELRAIFDKYIEVEDEVLSLLSVYTIATYFFRAFNTFPYLYICGPRQSGKTKLLGLLARLCYNAISTVNLSASALFRMVNDFGCTLIIDESEYLRDMERKSEIQMLLLAGYKKDTSNVMRVEGEERKAVRIFNVFGPKVMASINYPNDVLLDRCIVVNMLRGVSQKINLEPSETFQETRDKLYLLLFTRFDEVYEMRNRDDFDNPLLVARERELWRPLLVVASWIGQYMDEGERAKLQADLDKLIEDNLLRKAEMRVDSELNTLLYALSKVVQEDGYYAVSTIRDAILDEYRLDDSLYRQAQKNWSPEKIGRMLTYLKLRKKRKGDGTYYYITVEGVRGLCQRYGVNMLEAEEAESAQDKLEGDDAWWTDTRA